MYFFDSRYDAVKNYPNCIIRKVLTGHNKGRYTAFFNVSTYESWKNSGLVK